MEDVRRTLLRKLVKHGYWGGRHTNFDNLPKGFPNHLRKDVKKVAKELIKEAVLLKKPTGYGIEVSLNPRESTKIMKYLSEQEI
ncbi:MAG: hypothetical protein U9M95_01080 [Candidatus Altiarchaeota archaeon]|nr:hypothetical protein [Candidatus Altiarchaeota archaeon]